MVRVGIAGFLDVEFEKAHRAQHDVKAAIKLLSLNNQNGKPYFLELLKKIPNGRIL